MATMVTWSAAMALLSFIVSVGAFPPRPVHFNRPGRVTDIVYSAPNRVIVDGRALALVGYIGGGGSAVSSPTYYDAGARLALIPLDTISAPPDMRITKVWLLSDGNLAWDMRLKPEESLEAPLLLELMQLRPRPRRGSEIPRTIGEWLRGSDLTVFDNLAAEPVKPGPEPTCAATIRRTEAVRSRQPLHVLAVVARLELGDGSYAHIRVAACYINQELMRI